MRRQDILCRDVDLAGSDGYAGVTVHFEVCHASCLIMPSDVAGSKVRSVSLVPNGAAG
jgi:hypothetical protein